MRLSTETERLLQKMQWEQWQWDRDMGNLATDPLPQLPPVPTDPAHYTADPGSILHPTNAMVDPNQVRNITWQLQHEGYTVDSAQIEALLRAGYSPDTVKNILREGLYSIFNYPQGSNVGGFRDDVKSLLIEKFTQSLEDLNAGKITQRQFNTRMQEVNKVVTSIFNNPASVNLMVANNIEFTALYAEIEDSNVDFRLTPNNGITALIGPVGTVRIEVAGPGGPGGDVKFYDDKGKLIFTRENKSLTTTGRVGFNSAISDAIGEIPEGQPGEIFLQMQSGTNSGDIDSWVKRYMGSRISAGKTDKYKNIFIRVVDPSGNVIYAKKLMP